MQEHDLMLFPQHTRTHVNLTNFGLVSCMRLGISLPFSQLLEHCGCGQKLDQEGFYLIT